MWEQTQFGAGCALERYQVDETQLKSFFPPPHVRPRRIRVLSRSRAYSVTVAHARLIKPAEIYPIEGEFRLH